MTKQQKNPDQEMADIMQTLTEFHKDPCLGFALAAASHSLTTADPEVTRRVAIIDNFTLGGQSIEAGLRAAYKDENPEAIVEAYKRYKAQLQPQPVP